MSYNRKTLSIKQTTKPVFEQAKEAVAKELGEKPTHDETIRELAEAYCGHNACGAWRETSDLEFFEQPVMYGTAENGSDIWHLPVERDGEIVALCGVGPDNPKLTEYSEYEGRHNPGMCGRCLNDNSGKNPYDSDG